MGKTAIEGAKRGTVFIMDPEDIVVIGHDTEDGPEHPLWDERASWPASQELKASIISEGIIQPVAARKCVGGVVECVVGRQRVKAAREANKELAKAGKELVQVPVMLKRGPDEAMMDAVVSENEIRRDDDVSTKAAKLVRYLSHGRTEAEAAVKFGVSRQTISNWLTLSEASPELRAAVDAGEMNASAATKLAKLPRQEQAKAVAENKGKKVSKADAERMAKGDGPSKPKGRLVRKLLDSRRQTFIEDLGEARWLSGSEDYEAGFLAGIRWMLGELSDSKVKNLRAALRDASGENQAAE
jgi:ParB family chromosome partitioning protein